MNNPTGLHKSPSTVESVHKGARDLPLDFTKGVLVIVMVIYHTMNVFSMAGPVEFGYVRFVTGSFIFISGYIIVIFYEERMQVDLRGASIRLIIRGIKLLAVFTFLNLAISITGYGNPTKIHFGIYQFIHAIPSVYVFGTPGMASFQILLPIAYLLIVAPVILMITGYIRYIVMIALVITTSIIIYMSASVTADLIMDGFVGILVGMYMNNKDNPKYAITNAAVLVPAVLATMCSMSYLSRNKVTYIISIIVFLKLTYDIASLVDLKNKIMSIIILFGQYTLVCYIMQIVFLQELSRMLDHPIWTLGYELIVIFMLANAFLLAFCMLLSFYRRRSKAVDRAYRFILA